MEDHCANTLPGHHAGSRVLCNTMTRTEGAGEGKNGGPLPFKHVAQLLTKCGLFSSLRCSQLLELRSA